MRSEFVVEMDKGAGVNNINNESDLQSDRSSVYNTENGRRSIVFVKNEADSTSRLSKQKFDTELDVEQNGEEDGEVELVVA